MLNSIRNVKLIKMRKLTMFITAVCVSFLIKLRLESQNKFERPEDKPGGCAPLNGLRLYGDVLLCLLCSKTVIMG